MLGDRMAHVRTGDPDLSGLEQFAADVHMAEHERQVAVVDAGAVHGGRDRTAFTSFTPFATFTALATFTSGCEHAHGAGALTSFTAFTAVTGFTTFTALTSFTAFTAVTGFTAFAAVTAFTTFTAVTGFTAFAASRGDQDAGARVGFRRGLVFCLRTGAAEQHAGADSDPEFLAVVTHGCTDSFFWENRFPSRIADSRDSRQ
jgi:hypothetical protein